MPDALDSTRITAARVHALAGSGPLRVADALKAGITRGALRAAIASGDLDRPSHGVIAVADPDVTSPTLQHRCRAMAARRPSIVFSHSTASELQNLPLLRNADRLIHGYAQHAARAGDLLLHEGRIPTDHIVEVDGIRMTSPLRTALDLARGLPFAEALIPLDAALRSEVLQAMKGSGLRDDDAVESREHLRVVREDAEHLLLSLRHLHGARNARRALAAASPLAESPAESASRGHLLTAGIIPRALQARVIDADGRERRLDFLLDTGVAGEVDGFVKYEGDGGRYAVRQEKRRDLALQRIGLATVHWSAEEAFWHPQRVVRLVRHALISHPATG